MATEPGGSWVGVGGESGGLLIVKKKEKVRSRESKGKKRQIESEIERCGVRGYGPLCPAGDYRWPSELNQNCADCQGMGSATHRVPHERGVRLAQREEAEGEGLQPQSENRLQMSF